MDKKTIKKINEFVRSVSDINPGFKKAYLFGSFARKSNNPDSDIDIALIIDDLKDDDRFDSQVQLILIASKIDSRIEPHPISSNDLSANNPFWEEIEKTGIEIMLNKPENWYS